MGTTGTKAISPFRTEWQRGWMLRHTSAAEELWAGPRSSGANFDGARHVVAAAPAKPTEVLEILTSANPSRDSR
jgi:hypothetical protein